MYVGIAVGTNSHPEASSVRLMPLNASTEDGRTPFTQLRQRRLNRFCMPPRRLLAESRRNFIDLFVLSSRHGGRQESGDRVLRKSVGAMPTPADHTIVPGSGWPGLESIEQKTGVRSRVNMAGNKQLYTSPRSA